MRNRLSGKTALLTGAAQRIGRGHRRGFGRGWPSHRVIAIDLNADKLSELPKQAPLKAKRFSNYGLTLHPEKTRLVKFGRVALQEAERMGKAPDTVDFLGLTQHS